MSAQRISPEAVASRAGGKSTHGKHLRPPAQYSPIREFLGDVIGVACLFGIAIIGLYATAPFSVAPYGV